MADLQGRRGAVPRCGAVICVRTQSHVLGDAVPLSVIELQLKSGCLRYMTTSCITPLRLSLRSSSSEQLARVVLAA